MQTCSAVIRNDTGVGFFLPSLKKIKYILHSLQDTTALGSSIFSCVSTSGGGGHSSVCHNLVLQQLLEAATATQTGRESVLGKSSD